MVSQTQPEASVGMVSRGFIPEETVIAAGPGNALVTYYRPFWRPVVAGTLFALSVFVLSWFLMLGCHVGILDNGVLALGGGAAVWLWVTACIAFFFGGMIASAMTASPGDTPAASNGSGWLKGAVIWAFSIPLALGIYALLAQSSGLLISLGLPHVGVVETGSPSIAATGARLGYYWAVFIGLALAFIFSIVGSRVGCACRQGEGRYRQGEER